jgi:hypothetical protein
LNFRLRTLVSIAAKQKSPALGPDSFAVRILHASDAQSILRVPHLGEFPKEVLGGSLAKKVEKRGVVQLHEVSALSNWKSVAWSGPRWCFRCAFGVLFASLSASGQGGVSDLGAVEEAGAFEQMVIHADSFPESGLRGVWAGHVDRLIRLCAFGE